MQIVNRRAGAWVALEGLACAKLHTFLLMSLGMVAAAGCSSARAIPLSECLSQSDVSNITRHFISHFPDKTAFDNFVDPAKFKLLTNAADGAMLERSGKPANEKIDWFIALYNDHKALFSDLTEFNKPEFEYEKGQLRGEQISVESGRSTRVFPKNECVLDVTYRIRDGQCIMSQQLSNLAITFIKERGKVKLSSIEVFFITCQESKPEK